MQLHNYQQKAFKFLVDKIATLNSAALFLRMGLGKTLPTLMYLEYLKSIGEKLDVLIIAPKMVALYTWPNEIKKWGFSFSFRQLAGLPAGRRRQILNKHGKCDIDIINIDILRWMIEENYMRYDMIIIDELSCFKDHDSKRFKAFKRLVTTFKYKIIGLTGTPAPNNLIQLWPMMYLLDRGQRLGKNITTYRNEYFYPGFITPSRVVTKWNLRDGCSEDIYKAIGDIVYCVNDTSLIDVPPLIDIPYYVHLDNDVKRLYRDFKRNLLVSIEDVEIEGVNAAVMTNKLIQFNSGCIYDEKGYEHIVHTAKIEALKELLSFMENDNVLICYWFKHEKHRLLELGYPELDIELWNSGKQPIAIIHPASCGHGLNLQSGGSVFIWFTLTWSLELYEQTLARLLRQGQKLPVRSYKLLIPNSIDEEIVKVLEGKKNMQNALMDALQIP